MNTVRLQSKPICKTCTELGRRGVKSHNDHDRAGTVRQVGIEAGVSATATCPDWQRLDVEEAGRKCCIYAAALLQQIVPAGTFLKKAEKEIAAHTCGDQFSTSDGRSREL
ncbi:hypothetical protein TIFTF001_017506 [Ficus carica]|uniref:Uncharacterized protein n=1 Tax=Ficus carica TaxID=3494 RepID=A0AA88D8D2_FICCA|nr:hypothetical protein TIFTF001_017506 [Ficus carica]